MWCYFVSHHKSVLVFFVYVTFMIRCYIYDFIWFIGFVFMSLISILLFIYVFFFFTSHFDLCFFLIMDYVIFMYPLCLLPFSCQYSSHAPMHTKACQQHSGFG